MANELKMIKKDTVDVVAERVRDFQESGELDLPDNYSAENAMKSAWLKLQSTQTKGKKPVLQACTKDSIANSLLEMVVQGLNPAKDQCYFIAYGTQLVCQRSYFGNIALAKRVANVKDVTAQVVREGDNFEFEIKSGRYKITEHKQSLDSLNSEIQAAYAIVEFEDERPDYVEIMNIDQIKSAWQMGNYSPNGNGTHQKFSAEMAKKTVINRATKKYINSSHDDSLLSYHISRSEEDMAEQEVQQEIAEEANSGEVIDVEPEPEESGEGNGEAVEGNDGGNQSEEQISTTEQAQAAPEPQTPPEPAEEEADAPGQQQELATAEGPGF